ncbi:MAG: hypothetical protein ACK4NC_04855 [Candidatus Gracilibacteria bacterium]
MKEEKCLHCGNVQSYEYQYCQKCGEEMKGEEYNQETASKINQEFQKKKEEEKIIDENTLPGIATFTSIAYLISGILTLAVGLYFFQNLKGISESSKTTFIVITTAFFVLDIVGVFITRKRSRIFLKLSIAYQCIRTVITGGGPIGAINIAIVIGSIFCLRHPYYAKNNIPIAEEKSQPPLLPQLKAKSQDLIKKISVINKKRVVPLWVFICGVIITLSILYALVVRPMYYDYLKQECVYGSTRACIITQ